MPARAAVRPPGRWGRADAPAGPCGAKVCAACAAQKKSKAKPFGRVAALLFFWRGCRTIFPAKVPGAEKRPCMVVAVFRPRGPPPPPGTNRGGGVVAPRPCVATTPSRAGGFAVCGPLRAAAATISNGPHRDTRGPLGRVCLMPTWRAVKERAVQHVCSIMQLYGHNRTPRVSRGVLLILIL